MWYRTKWGILKDKWNERDERSEANEWNVERKKEYVVIKEEGCDTERSEVF